MTKRSSGNGAAAENEGPNPDPAGNGQQAKRTKLGPDCEVMPCAEEFVRFVNYREELYVTRLAEAVAIPSVSSWPDHRGEVRRMIDWTKSWIERLGGTATVSPNPVPEEDGPLGRIPNPPILLGSFGNDPSKRTVCVYGHLDVQPARKEDGWDTEPFVLTEIDGRLYGRGASDDKGPALCWLWVVEALRELQQPLPVNIKLIYEGLEEYGSEGMQQTIAELSKPGAFLADVDYFCISDNYWIGKTTPCLTYGLRGLAYFELSVKGMTKDLHSGVYGGSVHEPMTDLVHLMAKLVNSKGEITVPGVLDDVAALTATEAATYPTIDFDLETYKTEVGVTGISDTLLKPTKEALLMARWREPTLSLHGIEGAFFEPGAKTVIPRHVRGKFSLRLVPDQDPQRIQACIKSHVDSEFAKLDSPNQVQLVMHHAGRAWVSDPEHPNYMAGRRAVERVFGKSPDLTREGGSIPIANWIEDLTGMNVLLLPVGACDDGAHSQNEKLDRTNYINGIKVLGMYIYEIAQLGGPKPSSCRCVVDPAAMLVPGGFSRGFRCKCEI